MVLRELITLLLITGSIAEEEFRESREALESQEYYNHRYERKDAAKQFEKDYNRWGEKKHEKHSSEEFRDRERHLKKNEIDEREYVDKYNKYGNTFNSNLIQLKKEKISYHDKDVKENKKHDSLLHDTDVNYINNNKKIEGESELINESRVDVSKTKENYQENYQNKKDTNMERYKKNFYYRNIKKLDFTNPPPKNDSVLMARYIVHIVDWAALGTLSGRAPTKGAPFICVKAISDGISNSSSGIPYFYMSPLDICTQDLQKDNRASVLMTLSETEYCKNKNLDPQDLRCAKLTLSGKIKKIKPGSEEEKFAKTAFFTRHPDMENWPADHNWYFTKLKIGQIILLDRFGGATYIPVKDYLNGVVETPQI